MNRTLHRWNAVIQGDNGETKQVEIQAYWDPEREETPADIAQAAACQTMTFGRRGPDGEPVVRYAPIAASLIEPEAA